MGVCVSEWVSFASCPYAYFRDYPNICTYFCLGLGGKKIAALSLNLKWKWRYEQCHEKCI